MNSAEAMSLPGLGSQVPCTGFMEYIITTEAASLVRSEQTASIENHGKGHWAFCIRALDAPVDRRHRLLLWLLVIDL